MALYKLKPGHPSGSYQRAGIRFGADAPVEVADDHEQIDVLRNDPWLMPVSAPAASGGPVAKQVKDALQDISMSAQESADAFGELAKSGEPPIPPKPVGAVTPEPTPGQSELDPDSTVKGKGRTGRFFDPNA